MQELKVIGVENGALLVASDEGTHYRVTVDDALQSRLRQSIPDPGSSRKLAPREIQAHIRAGMSAEDVAAVTGASLDYIQRFEGPVLAEREFVIESALNVPVHTAVETDPLLGGATFGEVIRRRLSDAHAISERWASWKEQGGGWIVKLTFVAEQIEHDARWSFEPKKQALAPLNSEATSLSQQGELPPTLLPRLRAVPLDEQPESARFDSGAFAAAELGEALSAVPVVRAHVDIDIDLSADADEPPARNQTADLLEALRRRRGERDPMDPDSLSPSPADAMAAHPSTGTIRLVEIPLDGIPEAPQTSRPQNTTGSNPAIKSKGRKSMPSWDEIVFGARSDDDL